jgi:hypothetical protein
MGLMILFFIIMGINMLQPIMSTCLILALTLGPIASAALISFNSFSVNSKEVTDKATYPNLLKSLPINISVHDYEFRLQKESSSRAISRTLESKRKLRLLYKKLQYDLECCGVNGYSDCTGIPPVVRFVHEQNSSSAFETQKTNAAITNSKARRREAHRISATIPVRVRYSADYREEVCKNRCLRFAVSCVDEIKTGNEYCGEAITSVLIVYYAVFIYTVVICWCYMRNAGGISVFTFANVLPPVLPAFPSFAAPSSTTIFRSRYF